MVVTDAVGLEHNASPTPLFPALRQQEEDEEGGGGRSRGSSRSISTARDWALLEQKILASPDRYHFDEDKGTIVELPASGETITGRASEGRDRSDRVWRQAHSPFGEDEEDDRRGHDEDAEASNVAIGEVLRDRRRVEAVEQELAVKRQRLVSGDQEEEDGEEKEQEEEEAADGRPTRGISKSTRSGQAALADYKPKSSLHPLTDAYRQLRSVAAALCSSSTVLFADVCHSCLLFVLSVVIVLRVLPLLFVLIVVPQVSDRSRSFQDRMGAVHTRSRHPPPTRLLSH